MIRAALHSFGETLTAVTTDLPRLMLTVREASEILNVGRSTVYGLMDSGELESVHIGRLRRIPMQAVTDYVERKRSEP
jgi:excisionase family DNA binding protein